jgi:hypothetical protein
VPPRSLDPSRLSCRHSFPQIPPQGMYLSEARSGMLNNIASLHKVWNGDLTDPVAPSVTRLISFRYSFRLNLTIPLDKHKLERGRLCGPVVRVLGYRSGGPGSISFTTSKKKVVGLERGPLSLVSTTEELFESSGSFLENREYGRRDPSCWPRCTLYPQKRWQSLRRQAAVARSV